MAGLADGEVRVRLFRRILVIACVFLALGGLWRLPLAQAQEPEPDRRVNVPYFNGDIDWARRAIFWFGQVDSSSNYADGRMGYNNSELAVTVHVFDRRLWCDTTPSPDDLTRWDAAALYLDLDGNSGDSPSSTSYRFVAQLDDGSPRDAYQAVYRGSGSDWATASTAFTTTTGWRGNYFNDNVDDRGWWVSFRIPFTNLGLSGPPPTGTVWGLALALYDRDDGAGTPIPVQTWPGTMESQRPATWGQLVFGIPAYSPPPTVPGGLVTVRHGLNGASVVDAHVGGHSTCGEPFSPNFFQGWGDANYAGYAQINIQNQNDLADWPCFSKYYVTFPLDGLPAGKTIISATLRMYLFGNAGYHPGQAQPSLIQVLGIAEDWDESTITWNNAPLAVENVAATWVAPVDFYAEWPGVPVEWDVTRAVAAAYAAGGPLRLALYSADTDYHSGKYFWSSDAGEAGRPTLEVLWGEASFKLGVTPAVQRVKSGGAATYTIRVEHGDGFTPTIGVQASPSPSPDLAVALASPTSFDPPGGQTSLTLTDLHDPSFSLGMWYSIGITATGGGISQSANVGLLVNGETVYLPVVVK